MKSTSLRFPPLPERSEASVHESVEAWLAKRRSDITASDVGYLFDGTCLGLPAVPSLVPPWKTKSLQDVMSRKVEPSRKHSPTIDSGLAEAGHIYEPAVAEMVRIRRPEWKVERATARGRHLYLRMPRCALGATPDPWWTQRPGDEFAVPMELKSLFPWEFDRHGWADGPPGHVSLQALVQAMLAGATGCVVACLVRGTYSEIGQDGKKRTRYAQGAVHFVPRHEELEKEVCRRAAIFGRHVRGVRRRLSEIAARQKEAIRG